jgi:glycosyltransferase involved in cell wall biosynthesis
MLHSGIDCAKFKYTEPRRAGPTRIVTISRLVEKKGVTYALKAVAQVAASGARLITTLSVTGHFVLTRSPDRAIGVGTTSGCMIGRATGKSWP